MNPKWFHFRFADRFAHCLVLLLCGWLLAGCKSTPPDPALQRFQFNAPHMGTMFGITLFASDSTIAQHAAEAAFARVAELDRMMTDYDPQSELMQLCRRPAGVPVKVSPELFEVLQRAQHISVSSFKTSFEFRVLGFEEEASPGFLL